MPSVPPSPMNWRMTPCQARKSASVTTNEGIPILETRNPVRTPIAPPTLIASSISIHGLAAVPESTSAMASTANPTPAQIRRTTPSSAAIASTTRNAMNTPFPMPPSRFPLRT